MVEKESFDSYKELAEYMVDSMHKLTGAEVNLWTMIDREGENLQYMEIIASRGKFDEKYKRNAKLSILPDSSITALALETGVPIIRSDIQSADELPRFHKMEEAVRHGWHSYLVLPLIGIDGTRLGSFSLYSREKGKFGNFDIELLKNFSGAAAIALQKQKESKALQKLAKVGEFLTRQTFINSNLLEVAVKKACELFQADCAYICRYEAKGQRCDRIEYGSLCDELKSKDKPCIKCPSSLEQDKEKVWLKCLTAMIRQTGDIVVHNVDEGEIEMDLSCTVKLGVGRDEIGGIIKQTQYIECEGIKAFVGMPLITGEESTSAAKKEVGVLSVNFRSPHHFTRDELQMLRIFAHQVANAIINVRLYEKAKKQAEELEAIHETSLKIVAQEERDELLLVIVEESVKLLNAKGGMIFLRVSGQKNIKLVAQKNAPHEKLKVGDILSFEEGMAGRVIQTGIPMIVDDYSQWEGHIKRIAHLFSAMIEVPLLLGEEPIGVILVFDDGEKRTFTEEDDLPILERLAQQAALAIHNSRLLEKERTLRRQAEFLREVSGAIGSVVELKKTAETILDKLSNIVEFRRSSIQLIREDSGELLAYRGYSRKVIDKGLLQPLTILKHVIKVKKPVILSDTSKSEDWIQLQDKNGDEDIMSWAAFPLVYRDEVIGLLTLDHEQPDFYNNDILEVLIPFADQAAITIGNARLLNDAQRRIRDLEIIQNIVESINESLNIKNLLKTVVSQIFHQLDCSHCTLFLPSRENNKLLLIPHEPQGWNIDQIMKRRFKPGEGLAGWVFQNGQPLLLPDASKDPRFAEAATRKQEPRSMLVYPIKVGDRTIGIISADKNEKNWFKDNDMQKVEELARHAGIAIERGIGQNLLSELSSQIISATEEDIILQRLVYGAIKLTNTTTGIIYIIGEGGSSILKDHAYPFHYVPLAPRMNNEDGITRQVIKTGKTMIFPDITKDNRVNPELHKYFRAMLAVPLKIEGKVMGVLFLHNREPRFFSETELFLLETLTSQAAIAVKNAQLFGRIQKQHDIQIEAVRQISKSIAWPLNITHVLNNILKWVITIMGKINYCEISLLYGEKLIVVAEQGLEIKEEYREIPVGRGIVGWVALNKKSQMIQDVKKDLRYLDIFDGVKSGAEITVPILKGNELIGVINIEHPEVNAFKHKDLALVEAIAGLVTIAIENSNLYIDMESQVNKRTQELKKANEKTAAAAERLVLMNEMATEFVHKINNLAGTLPVRVGMLLKHLNKNNPDHQPLIEELETVKNDASLLLKAAGVIRRSTRAGEPEYLRINHLLDEVLRKVVFNVPIIAKRIKVKRDFSPDIPLIQAERAGFIDTIENIIKNGIDAIIGNGILKISTNIVPNNKKNFLNISISDTGKGIPAGIIDKIFDLFFTTKTNGLGFGLWRDRAFIKRLGGDIEVKSQEGKGTIFHLRIPIEDKINRYLEI